MKLSINHDKRLSDLLACNNLKVDSIVKDGNCFFEATVKMTKSANPHLTAVNLREIICDHMREFKQHFEPFFIQDDVNSYDNQVTKLASPGFWNVDVNPLRRGLT